MSNAGWNILGTRGAEMIGSGVAGGIGSKWNGDDFWSGKNYSAMSSFETGDQLSVEFNSYTGDNFRMHLHPGNNMSVVDFDGGVSMFYTSSYYPSGSDYHTASAYQKYGIQSYASAVRGGTTELYKYTYNNKIPVYWQASW